MSLNVSERSEARTDFSRVRLAVAERRHPRRQPRVSCISRNGTIAGVEIRPASAEDMLPLERALGPERTAFYRTRLKRNGVVLLAWQGEEPVGVVFVTWEAADEEVVRKHLPGVPFVHRLHVPAGLRERGLGHSLLREAEDVDEVRLAGRLAAGVDLRNTRGLGLYRRLGYQEWGRGIVDTFREQYERDGTVLTAPDRCRIFVKDLDSG